jgi:hypothetical protein
VTETDGRPRSPAVSSGLAVPPLTPSSPHPVGSSNLGPKSLGPTTTNRRRRLGGISRSEKGAEGGGEPTGGARAGPRASAGSQRASRAVSLDGLTRCGALTNQQPAPPWEAGPRIKSEGGSWEKSKRLGVTGIVANWGEKSEF